MSSMGLVKATKLQDLTPAETQLVADEYKVLCSPEQLAQRAVAMLEAQKGMYGGLQVDLYEHGVQTATRAYKDSADEETVVCCLLHDVGEHLVPSNHGEVIAAILRPYISEKNRWILANHEVFQGYYYFHHVGGDRNSRDMYKDNPYYQDMVDFCEKWDATSFDPNYKSMSLDTFMPMLIRIFSRKPFHNDPTNPKAVAVTGKQ